MVKDGLNNEPPLRSTGWRMFRPSETPSETQSEILGTKRQSASHSSSKKEPYRGDDMRALINFAMATGLAIVIGADFNYVDAQSISNGQAPNGPSAPASLPSNNTGAMSSSASTNPSISPVSGSRSKAINQINQVSAPTTTVGNTPSALSGSNNNTGYSAYGSTVNGNLNNTRVGNRGGGQPIGAGSRYQHLEVRRLAEPAPKTKHPLFAFPPDAKAPLSSALDRKAGIRYPSRDTGECKN